ncbi:ATP synthase subunit I [Viridibacillus sp. FSL R5-0477]|jgi:ATP synthase protein I|uniref:ATP synthase I n=1 Tax=Viridibacillus arenosi FSL R5-213 TaxID=1227360 RepID=W4F352_9BACL|nr:MULTISPECIES: ATP synthase subunit I [Viridibacillus]ETT87200.1 ATP synthase I [Viridibacillus arenosi FSL R5-213]OMC80197.1 ATP synthase subunit [Viridibacillus sp. FSL H8-0123]OMC87967.1 ATP synthase subunit [Viridibacillus sp. FSL H7-0596]OMC91518.1 ATP synthase subunit [Viridibacillus arenosi]
MLELHQIFAKQKRMLFFLLAFCALGWAFTPYQTVFAGLALGALFGHYNFWILVRRMERFDRSISEGKKVASLGSAFRFASGIAAVAVATMLPKYFHLISTVIGLMIPYVLLLVDRIVFHVKYQ